MVVYSNVKQTGAVWYNVMLPFIHLYGDCFLFQQQLEQLFSVRGMTSEKWALLCDVQDMCWCQIIGQFLLRVHLIFYFSLLSNLQYKI
jgi:hypothetical protein